MRLFGFGKSKEEKKEMDDHIKLAAEVGKEEFDRIFIEKTKARSKNWMRDVSNTTEPLPEDATKIFFNTGVTNFYAGSFLTASNNFKKVLEFDSKDKEAKKFLKDCETGMGLKSMGYTYEKMFFANVFETDKAKFS